MYLALSCCAGQEKDPQKRQQQLTEQRQLAETAAVRLQARLAADTNLLLAAKLPTPEAAEDAAPAAAGGGPAQQEGAPAAAAAAPQGPAGAAAASNPFFAAPWGDMEAAGQQAVATGSAGQAAQSLDQALPPASAGPAGVLSAVACVPACVACCKQVLGMPRHTCPSDHVCIECPLPHLQASGSRRHGMRVLPPQAAGLRHSSCLPVKTGRCSSSGVRASQPAAGGCCLIKQLSMKWLGQGGLHAQGNCSACCSLPVAVLRSSPA